MNNEKLINIMFQEVNLHKEIAEMHKSKGNSGLCDLHLDKAGEILEKIAALREACS